LKDILSPGRKFRTGIRILQRKRNRSAARFSRGGPTGTGDSRQEMPAGGKTPKKRRAAMEVGTLFRIGERVYKVIGRGDPVGWEEIPMWTSTLGVIRVSRIKNPIPTAREIFQAEVKAKEMAEEMAETDKRRWELEDEVRKLRAEIQKLRVEKWGF